MSAEEEVRKASENFYTALNKMANGDSGAMAEAWLHSDTVTAMHPIGGRSVGWVEVAESFVRVAEIASDGAIALKDQMIEVAGDMAYETGTEAGAMKLGGHAATIDQRVTNIYRKRLGGWTMVHHHVDPSPSMHEVMAKLLASGG